MADSDSAEFRHALQAAKLDALAEIAAGAGHEINNPLATILGRTQLLLAGETDPDRRQALMTIGGQALRIRDMIGDLMLFARPPKMQPRSLDLIQVVRQVLLPSDVAREAMARGVQIDVAAGFGSPVPVWADDVQLQVVISNLVRNSLESVPDGGHIAVACEAVSVDGQASALLSVSDNGTGLSDVDREHLFEPFYSGRQAGRGLGFGLCKCWRIVTLHGGRIDVTSIPGDETRFTVVWPAAPRSD